MRIAGASAAALVGALLLLASPASAAVQPTAAPTAEQPDPAKLFSEQADGRIIHRQSGFSVPPALAGLPRVGIKVISDDDFMTRYSRSDDGMGDAWLDLILYPAGQPLQAEAELVEKLLVGNFSAKAIPAPAPLPKSASDGRSGWFRGTIKGQEYITSYAIVQRGGWFVKIRATAREGAVDELVKALAAAPWEWAPTGQPKPAEPAVAGR